MMSTTLLARAPRARCHECGSPDLSVTCHHCGRALCGRHGRQALNASGEPVSAEFAGLGLDKTAPRHCADCEHTVKRGLVKVVTAGAALAAAGLLLMFASVGLGFTVLLAGAAVAVVSYLVHRNRKRIAAATRPPLPVLPNVSLVEVRETLAGKLRLDRDGRYHSSVQPVAGTLRLDMTTGRSDWERLESYRDKYRLGAGEKVEFCAGFAVLRGQVGVRFHDEHTHRTTIQLTGDVDGHPFFTAPADRVPGQWSITMAYDLAVTNEIDSIPIWLTPSLVPGQDQRALDLELQWTKFGREELELEIDRIEPLRILVPVAWGNIEDVSESGVTTGIVADPDDPDETVRQIECTRLSMTEGERRDRRVRLAIRFENQIELTDTIRGDFEVSFRGGLSGVTDVDVFHPLGERRHVADADRSVRTVLRADFDLSLRGIRYQDLRMVPDMKIEADRDKPETFPFAGVIPDHETVIDLTNELSKARYYVKRVIENPPRSGAKAHLVNRYWDIAGRRYDGVYPVDFHVVLMGEEVHDGDIRPRAGNTTARITVQGAYTNRVPDDPTGQPGLAEKIIQVWQHLCDTTIATLGNRARPAHVMSGNGAPEASNGHANASAETGAVGDVRAGRIAVLRKRLDEADEAVIQGRISDDTHRKINENIRRELRDLNGE